MLLTGILFANGRRTVTSWLRAAGVSDDDYFLARVGHKTHSIATPLVALIPRTLSLPDRLLLVITFLATYLPVGGVIRVVLIKEDPGWLAFFCTQPDASVMQILEAFADRATIEQDFHDVKEVWETGQQQVRNIGTSTNDHAKRPPSSFLAQVVTAPDDGTMTIVRHPCECLRSR